jgi:hypothetical protein
MSDQNQNDATNDQKTNDSDATPNPGAKGDQSEITFTDEQQKLLNKRIADARREGRAQAESDAAAAKQAAEAEAERQRQIDAGQFDTVRQSLETERDQALAKASQFDALIEAIKPEIDTQWAALPDEVTALYEGDDTGRAGAAGAHRPNPEAGREAHGTERTETAGGVIRAHANPERHPLEARRGHGAGTPDGQVLSLRSLIWH